MGAGVKAEGCVLRSGKRLIATKIGRDSGIVSRNLREVA